MSLRDKGGLVDAEAMSARGKRTSEWDEGMSVCCELTAAA